MTQISPPVQEALSVLEKLQADAYQRGWNDAMASVASFAATSKSGHGALEITATRAAASEAKQRRPRGPNRNSVPSRILALLDSGPIDQADMVRRAQAAIPNETVAIINRSIARLMDRKLMVLVGTQYIKAGAVQAAPATEIPEAAMRSERSGLFTASDNREHNAAA
jgi:hypothetical protein